MPKDLKRARRRRNRARMIARAKRLYPCLDVPQKAANNLAQCSCWACGNPRRYWGERTLQEQRQDLRPRDCNGIADEVCDRLAPISED